MRSTLLNRMVHEISFQQNYIYNNELRRSFSNLVALLDDHNSRKCHFIRVELLFISMILFKGKNSNAKSHYRILTWNIIQCYLKLSAVIKSNLMKSTIFARFFSPIFCIRIHPILNSLGSYIAHVNKSDELCFANSASNIEVTSNDIFHALNAI